MATLYKNRNIWYITVSAGNKRLTRSLRTKDKQVARQLKPGAELELLSLLSGVTQQTQNVPFDELVRLYLKVDRNWSKRTKELNEYVFKSYLSGKPLPSNPTSRAIFVRTVNACWNWGLKQGLVKKAYKLEGDTKGESRHRVLNDAELKKLFDEIRDNHFNQFVRFAYYSGARSGEIRRISRENVFPRHIVAYGKSGKRLIKLNNQAKSILDGLDELWNYRKDFVSHKFKKEARRLGISDIRFHDLRRTFGYNLIRQGRPIYEVSKLLGHSSVTTTERHYAPLLATDIDDFIL
jgi:integrase